MNKKSFYVFFPKYEDFHFWKDPGQIPFRLLKLGYDVKIITRKNGNYSTTIKNLQMSFIRRKNLFGKDIGLILFFIRNSQKIDILNVFHLDGWESLFATLLYKTINPKGFVYLKMDNCHSSGNYIWESIFDSKIVPASFFSMPKKNIKWKVKALLIKKIIINQIDLFSIEDEKSKNYFETKYSFFKKKIVVAYNGHTIDLVNKELKVKSFEKKENLIITVGRLGIYPKNTLNLLKGFAMTAQNHNWKLKLAGPIHHSFNKEIEEFFNIYPKLKNRIEFLGNLDKKKLFELYNNSKIFLLPSNFEGFAIVYAEAMYFCNAIITTPYTSVKSIVQNNNLGLLVEPESIEEIGNAVLELIKNEEKVKTMCENSMNFAENNLHWDKIIKMLIKKIEVKNE